MREEVHPARDREISTNQKSFAIESISVNLSAVNSIASSSLISIFLQEHPMTNQHETRHSEGVLHQEGFM
jgi:hypothetical protein